MAYQLGEDFEVWVNDVTGATGADIIGNMNSFSKSSNRGRDTFPVFGSTLPIIVPGSREQTYSISGFFDPTDAGQVTCRTAEAADTTVFLRVMYDGTNGFEQECRVGSFTYNTSPTGLQEHGFEFTAVDDATAIGSGPIV